MESPRSKRVISQSTGLAKFNITQRLNNTDQLNKEFSELEKSVRTEEHQSQPKSHQQPIQAPGSPIRERGLKSKRSGLALNLKGNTIVYSPHTSPIRNQDTIHENDDGDQMLQLASKQRELLEYKEQMNQLKKKIEITEKEVSDLQRKFNHYNVEPTDNNKTLRSPSPATRTTQRPLQELNSRPSLNFNNLKKKLSMQQINTKQSMAKINYNYNNITKDTNILISKGLNFMNNIKNEIRLQTNEFNNLNMSDKKSDLSDYDDTDSDLSDYEASDVTHYGCADTSDFGLAVK